MPAEVATAEGAPQDAGQPGVRITEVRLRHGRIVFCGAFVSTGHAGDGPVLGVLVDGVEVPSRQTVSRDKGPAAEFEVEAPVALPLFGRLPSIGLSARENGGAAVEVVPPVGFWLARLDSIVSDWKAFAAHTQIPATRLKDPETLALLSKLGFARFRNDPQHQACALCILNWRAFDGVDVGATPERQLRIGERLLDRLDARALPGGRDWYISLGHSLACLAAEIGRLDLAQRFFERVVARTDIPATRWVGAPNVVTARFMLGYLHLCAGRFAEAADCMDGLVDFFVKRVRLFSPVNKFVFDEIIEVSRTVQQAIIVRERIRPSGGFVILPGEDLRIQNISVYGLRILIKRKRLPEFRFDS